MKLENKKFGLDILMVFIVASSIVISIRSCKTSEDAVKTAKNAIKVSENSNRIANEALGISKYQFIQVNRPYINISPKKNENGQFWKVIQKGKVVETYLQYEIKNVGNVAAKNVRLPDKLTVLPGINLKEGAPITFQKHGKYTLGPGENYIEAARISISWDSIEDARKCQEELVSDKDEGILLQLLVDYTNELDESQKYRTIMMTRIHNDTALLLKSEMLLITEDEALKNTTKP